MIPRYTGRFFIKATTDKTIQRMLNQIRVGIVFTVEDHTSSALVPSANKYSHHSWVLNKRPGTIIIALITKAKNSTVFALFQ